MDDEHRAHRIGQARQRAKNEIAAPADRLKDPEGAILVVEEGPVETDPGKEGASRPLVSNPHGMVLRGGFRERPDAIARHLHLVRRDPIHPVDIGGQRRRA